MNNQKEPFGVRKFKESGLLRTDDAELFAETIMQLTRLNINFKVSNADSSKYCIAKV